MLCLAFYRGRRTLTDRVICSVTRSVFSHVELLPYGPGGPAISASGRDGGVRWAGIDFATARWDVIALPWAGLDTLDRAASELGKRYDFAALVTAQLLNLRRHRPDRWFCSELCAHAIGLAEPHTYAPGDLHRTVLELNRVYQLGRTASGEPPEE